MKLNTQKKSVQTGGIRLSTSMKIDMNGKAFNVLSSGIYSNIIPTVVRELSSNAHDAHIKAEQDGDVGKATTPFEVQLPAALDPHFAVKDCGTGLRYFKYSATVTNEHEGESTIYIHGDIRDKIRNIDVLVLNGDTTVDVGALLFDTKDQQTVIRVPGDFEGTDIDVEFDDTLVLYSTYFRSTKEDSNDFTGAFGLGSKTPLAYTDNFLVTNRFNGVMRVYNIMTNENNEPQISLMMSMDTDEPNGLEVKLAVNPDDYASFKDAVVDQLKYFEPLPRILNDKVVFPEIVHRGKHFLIVNGLESTNGSYNRKSHACVGNNAYQIQRVQSNLFRDGNLVLRFAVGEVMVTTSREELKYEDETIELIAERERDAIAEYTKYVMDGIDDKGMSDFKKAEFLNNNHAVLDLSSADVRKKVGNPHYRYTTNRIHIPVSGWGDYTSIAWEENPVFDDNGVEIGRVRTGILKHNCYVNRALRWSTYSRGASKSRKVNGDQCINPTEDTLVFVRDNSYSFLKKINYYLEQENIDHDATVLILDMFSDNSSAVGFEALKSLVSHTCKFVTLSSIKLPKTISTTPTDRCATPTARMYKFGDYFHASKYWTPIYTPLTKIDTENTFVIPAHHGSIEELSNDDQNFLHKFYNSGLPYDTDVTILVLSRVKYEKALTYGFKPATKLVKKLKKSLTIPVELVNKKRLAGAMSEIKNNKILCLFREIGEDCTPELNRDAPVARLLRISELYTKRYGSKNLSTTDKLMQFIPDEKLPAASDFVEKTVDSITKMLYTVNNDLVLLNNMSTYEVRDVNKQEAMVKYANLIFNTGEV